MFNKDFHLLNELYNARINEMNLGPRGENSPATGFTPDKIVAVTKKCNCENEECTCKYAAQGCKCNGCAECKDNQHANQDEIDVKKSDLNKDGKLSGYEKARGAAIDKAMGGSGKLSFKGDEDCEECGGMCGSEHSEEEHGGYMTKQNLFRIVKIAAMLHDLLGDEENIEPWVLDKIARAQGDLNSIFGYKDYEKHREALNHSLENVEEETENDLFSAINTGSGSLLDALRKSLKSESRETVEKVLLEAIKVLETKK